MADTNKNQGRGWHGDPKGHAEAGAQSHKNDDQTQQQDGDQQPTDDDYE